MKQLPWWQTVTVMVSANLVEICDSPSGCVFVNTDAIWHGAWLITAKLVLPILRKFLVHSVALTVLNRHVWTISHLHVDVNAPRGGAVSWQALAPWCIILVFLLHRQANLNEAILWWAGKVHKRPHWPVLVNAWLQKWHFDLANVFLVFYDQINSLYFIYLFWISRLYFQYCVEICGVFCYPLFCTVVF